MWPNGGVAMTPKVEIKVKTFRLKEEERRKRREKILEAILRHNA